MSGIDPRRPVSDEDRFAYEIGLILDRLGALEAPTGTSIFQSVAKLTELVNDIQAALDEYNATRYTNAQVDAKDAAVAASILPTLAANAVTVGGAFYNPAGYAFDITYTRRTAWIGSDGRLGYAASSATKKTSIREADEERLARLLDIVPKSFLYREEVRRRTRLRIEEGVEYAPPREIGLIAEELDAAGLHEFVMYDDEGHPEGIEYSMLPVALLAVDRRQQRQIDELRADIAEIRATIG